MPSNRPDRAEVLDAYQSDRGVGANPNDAAFLATERSEPLRQWQDGCQSTDRDVSDAAP